MRIKVTEEHIKAGQRKKACACPVALALREQFSPLWLGVGVSHVEMWFIKDNVRVANKYYISETASAFITSFDQGLEVEPLEFELSAPLVISELAWHDG